MSFKNKGILYIQLHNTCNKDILWKIGTSHTFKDFSERRLDDCFRVYLFTANSNITPRKFLEFLDTERLDFFNKNDKNIETPGENEPDTENEIIVKNKKIHEYIEKCLKVYVKPPPEKISVFSDHYKNGKYIFNKYNYTPEEIENFLNPEYPKFYDHPNVQKTTEKIEKLEDKCKKLKNEILQTEQKYKLINETIICLANVQIKKKMKIIKQIIRECGDMSLQVKSELRKLCKKNKLTNYSQLNREKLVNFLIEHNLKKLDQLLKIN